MKFKKIYTFVLSGTYCELIKQELWYSVKSKMKIYLIIKVLQIRILKNNS